MTKEAAEKEADAVKGRITYSLNLEDLKDVDLVVEVRRATWNGRHGEAYGMGCMPSGDCKSTIARRMCLHVCCSCSCLCGCPCPVSVNEGGMHAWAYSTATLATFTSPLSQSSLSSIFVSIYLNRPSWRTWT